MEGMKRYWSDKWVGEDFQWGNQCDRELGSLKQPAIVGRL